MEELNNISAQQDVEVVAPVSTGYVKKFQLTEEQKKRVGVSPLSIISKIVIYVFLILFLIWTLLPFAVAIFGSMIQMSDYGIKNTSKLFPVNRAKFNLLSNYLYVFNGKIASDVFLTIKPDDITLTSKIKFFGTEKTYMRLPSSFIFTCVLVLPPTIIGLFTSAMSAFAFSKLHFKGSKWMFGLLLSTMMLPGALSLTPSFAIYRVIFNPKSMAMAFPLFIPGMFGAAAAVFFLKQYFTGIPTDLIEAGKLDGMGYYKMFFKIIVPLSGSALIAQGILGFVGGYNDYFGPMLYLSSAKDSIFETIQIALQQIVKKLPDGSGTPQVFAASMVALLPTLVIYFFAQRFFVEGIATSGMKI